MTERFITSTLNRRDPVKETSLRPPKFADFPGQDKVTYVKVAPEMVARIVNDHLVNKNVVTEYTIGAMEK